MRVPIQGLGNTSGVSEEEEADPFFIPPPPFLPYTRFVPRQSQHQHRKPFFCFLLEGGAFVVVPVWEDGGGL